MSQEIVETAVAVREPRVLMLTPVMNLQTALNRLREFQEFVSVYLQPSEDGGQDGGDYGAIPGAGKKKVLLKSGADKLCELYGLYDEYEDHAPPVEDWERGLFSYDLKCILKSRRDDSMVGSGLGCCSSWESKYRWRDSQRKCPTCNKENIRKSKPRNDGTGGGWYCWVKTGGCGATFKDGDQTIEGQIIGRIDNPDIIDAKNTVLKMAKKRAKIDAVIGVTRSSGIFTQDLEEIQAEAPKKEVARTTEPIDISGPPSKGAEPPQEGDAPAAEVSDCIDVGQAANFHQQFRKALRKEIQKQAEDLAHDFLRINEILDAEGKPSALAIKKASFYDVREAAIQHAKGL